jgi:hypothetical protein
LLLFMNNMAPVWDASTPSRNEASSSLCIKLQGTLPTLPITVCGYDSGNNEQGNEKKNKKNERRGEEEEKKKRRRRRNIDFVDFFCSHVAPHGNL